MRAIDFTGCAVVAQDAALEAPRYSRMGLEVIMFQEADWPRLASVLAGSAMESDIAVAVAPSNLHREHMRTAQECNRQLCFHMHEGGTVDYTSLFQRPVRCLQPWHMRRKASALLQLCGLLVIWL